MHFSTSAGISVGLILLPHQGPPCASRHLVLVCGIGEAEKFEETCQGLLKGGRIGLIGEGSDRVPVGPEDLIPRPFGAGKGPSQLLVGL